MPPQRMFTVFHALEAKGVFEANPNNMGARNADGEQTYRGPAKYPRMMYHPKGEEKVIKQAEAVASPFGPVWTNGHKELIHRLVNNAAEEKLAREEGWHDHSSDSIRAANDPNRPAPPKSADSKIQSLEEQIAAFDAEKAEMLAEKQRMADERAAWEKERQALIETRSQEAVPLKGTAIGEGPELGENALVNVLTQPVPEASPPRKFRS